LKSLLGFKTTFSCCGFQYDEGTNHSNDMYVSLEGKLDKSQTEIINKIINLDCRFRSKDTFNSIRGWPVKVLMDYPYKDYDDMLNHMMKKMEDDKAYHVQSINMIEKYLITLEDKFLPMSEIINNMDKNKSITVVTKEDLTWKR